MSHIQIQYIYYLNIMGNHQTLIPYTHSLQYRAKSVILITGASSGLGKQIAIQYSKRTGVTLLLIGRNFERLKITQRICEKNGAKTLSYICDISNEEQCIKISKQIVDTVKVIDLLVLNAGINAHSKFEDLKELNAAHQLMNTNYFANLYLFKHLFPLIKKSKSQIVVINSLSGRFGLPERSIYCASKFALAGFFDALRTEDIPIKITMIYPPSVDTPMRSHDILHGNTGASTLNDRSSKEQQRMSAEECSKLIVLAADYGVQSFYFPTKAYMANYLYPLFPKLIRQKLKKAAKL